MFDFKYQEHKKGDTVYWVFEGTIDEDARLPEFDSSGRYRNVEIDLNGVQIINSVGIREWMHWIRPIADQASIVLEKCQKAIVFQFNMIDGFLPANARVKSFYVPYYCAACEREDNHLFVVGQEVSLENGEVKIQFDPKAVGGCESESCSPEVDVNEAKYFRFLKRA